MRRGTIVLVGFMGAGKSVCGRLLARRLGRCLVETDDMIVAGEGRSISEIFSRDGEDRFRQLEADTVEALALKSGDVIATGGGLPCRGVRVADAGALAAAKGRDAEARAGRGRGPLHGVPVGIKDIFHVAGMPTRAGAKAFAHSEPREDATSVARLRAAGAVILGKTHTT